MYELRKNHIVQIPLDNNVTINGIVADYASDRVLVSIDKDSVKDASLLKELDELSVFVHTFMGIKKMVSSVISELDKNNCIIIENNPAVPVVQKRQFVRVLSSISFEIIKENKIIDCVCVNISAGGIAFRIKNSDLLQLDEILEFKFFERDFGKEIICRAKIIKKNNDIYVGQFMNLNIYDEDRIVRHVYNLITSQ